MAERIILTGQVQGVGFRPHVLLQARAFGIDGFVRNDGAEVTIVAAGSDIDAFLAAIRTKAPPSARIDTLWREPVAESPAPGFEIRPSTGTPSGLGVAPDLATCPDCLAEMRDATARRHGYAFTNCANCGPRLTILESMPYDRSGTTMAEFELCAACAAEYRDTSDRRFHAQPIACPACGPQLSYEGVDPGGDADCPLTKAVATLRRGGIVALKSLGGFHLSCDAHNSAAIERLRHRKGRPCKPFALMASLDVIRANGTVGDAAEQLLTSPTAPVVLLPHHGTLPDALAPGLDRLGWMLPSAPLHHLLSQAFGGALVMTSGNVTGAPMVTDNATARAALGAIADGFLMHDRPIARRVDDSVAAVGPAGPMTLRRARGLVPAGLPMPPGLEAAPSVLAFGGQMKAAICLTRGGMALLGHHMGDLDQLECRRAFDQGIADYEDLFGFTPELFACDLHPDFHASQVANQRGGKNTVTVQHHHAHFAACLGENLWPRDGDPVVGIVLDGLGAGPDGTVWGGEVLLGRYEQVERIANLSPAALIGGDAANREPWRNLLARLDQAGLSEEADRLLSTHPLRTARQIGDAAHLSPMSSSAGRLFDAVAAALGLVSGRMSYEGEAAMRLEALARAAGPEAPYPMDQLSPAPLFQALMRDLSQGVAPARVARRAIEGVAQGFADAACQAVSNGDAVAVALSGGCFQNTLLLERVIAALDGIPVLTHRQVPCNDGGLAFGQAMVAAAQT
ncbi:carbamoyltransferase HypF [Aliiroseovarius subalbicans]|uniref:carbamoyltransferase HypF n=1 Tax=Aliiroseovarius subalbicans TaxID=2925840 RepID=UPI001F588F23|nr:carbamoyltransferase HypF [Aliiroseovarius subalbicans]MCI2399669.1 carbamoyltransferase HypF [Aliiroseovarius subalbicans]